MESIRQRQTAEIIKRHFSMVLQQEAGYIDQSVLVTVTNVKMSSDLSIAKIYLSVFNTDNKQAVILELEDNYSRLRQLLGNRLKSHVRRIPHLEFFLDDTLDEMEKLNKLFDRLEEDNQLGKGKDE